MGTLEDFFNWIYDMNIEEAERRFLYLGEGISRAAFAINDYYVAKFAKNKDGDYQSRVEYHVYRHAGKYIDYLCPIVWYKKGLIIMRRAIPLEYLTRHDTIDISKVRLYRDSYRDLNELADKFNLLYGDITAVSSWGILENKLVLVDYGCKDW